MLGLEIADLQNAIDLGMEVRAADSERQFGLGQRQIVQPLGFVEVRQTIKGFLLGVRENSEQLIPDVHRAFFQCNANPLTPAFLSKRFVAEGGRRDDPGAASVGMRKQPGTTVTSHQIIGFSGQSHGEQECVIRVV